MSGRRRHRHIPPGESFILMPRRLLTHAAWISLPPAAGVIFLDMSLFHNGKNNGAIGYGVRAGAAAANCSEMTAWRALKRLKDARLIRLRKRGCFKAHDRLAAEWEVAIFTKALKPEWASPPLAIPHQILKSPAYRAMSNAAKVFLIEAMRRFDGGNNGSIVLGGKSGRYIGLSCDVTERAIAENARAGFLIETTANPGVGKPRTWRLTMLPIGRTKPTMEFLKTPETAAAKPSDGITGADGKASTVSRMRMDPNSGSPDAKVVFSENNDLPNFASAPSIRTSDTH